MRRRTVSQAVTATDDAYMHGNCSCTMYGMFETPPSRASRVHPRHTSPPTWLRPSEHTPCDKSEQAPVIIRAVIKMNYQVKNCAAPRVCSPPPGCLYALDLNSVNSLLVILSCSKTEAISRANHLMLNTSMQSREHWVLSSQI